MHICERCCKAIRHNYFLEKANWLWDAVCPFYERVFNIITFHKGLERMINGTDRVLIPIRLKSLSEIYEPKAWRHLMAQVRPGDIVADIGANIGLYTVALAKRVGSSGRVFAFEPDSHSFIFLKETVELNKVLDRVELIEKAVGYKDAYTAQCVSLDTFFAQRRLDILKIDVEGFEGEVLKGASSLLDDYQRRPRFILIEVHPHLWSTIGTTSESLLNFLNERKYTVLDKNGQFVSNIDFWDWVIAYEK